MPVEHAPQRYPLDWPVGEPRTPAHRREHGRFEVDFARARDDLMRSLKLLGARDVILSSNLPLRRDGLPLASAPKRPEDPGVAVYWTVSRLEGARWVSTPFVMACDRYLSPVANVRAIGLTVEALRAIERHGTRQLRDRAFQGFAALPPAAGASSWRAVLGLVDGAITREAIDEAYRRLAMVRHPDRGGTDELMAELNAARADALREVAHG